jgi:hypothetical protein
METRTTGYGDGWCPKCKSYQNYTQIIIPKRGVTRLFQFGFNNSHADLGQKYKIMEDSLRQQSTIRPTTLLI